MNNELILACDLGGTNLRMAAVNVKGEILHLVKLGTPKAKHPAEIARSIIEAAEQCRAAVRGFGTVRALAAAVPATINAADGIILKSPNVPALDGFRFSSIISNELSLPVILENDANAAAIGEHAFGAAKNFQNAVIVTLGTGVGGGIIINGNILRGINGTAGEIGHICVEPFPSYAVFRVFQNDSFFGEQIANFIGPREISIASGFLRSSIKFSISASSISFSLRRKYQNRIEFFNRFKIAAVFGAKPFRLPAPCWFRGRDCEARRARPKYLNYRPSPLQNPREDVFCAFSCKSNR
jgi:hypothetical protein